MKDPRPLSERFDLNYVRRRHWPGSWTYGLSLLLVVAAGVYMAAMAFRGKRNAYTAGPLTKAHAMFGSDCSQCHEPDPQKNGFWLPVTDAACLKCHEGTAHPDAARAVFAKASFVHNHMGAVSMARNCASCHDEHKGADHSLTRIDNRFCIQCHGDLPAAWKDAKPAALEGVAATIKSFGSDHPNWRVLEAKTIDTTPIRFEHQIHMNPRTPQMQPRLKAWVEALKKKGVPESRIPVTRTASDAGEQDVLACNACHQVDMAGQYMKPIVFEEHCAQCHGLGTRSDEAVPHGVAVAAFMDRIAAKQVLTPPAPAVYAGGPKKSGYKSGPGKPATTAPAYTPVTFESDKAMVDAVAKRVAAKREELMRGIKASCAKCHGIDVEATKIPDPHVPQRWLTRSRFDHQAHLFMSCVDCHAQAMPRPSDDSTEVTFAGEDDPKTDAGRLRWTGRTREVMLPSIQSCQKCHTPELAGDACVTCHDFHERRASK